MSINVTPGDPNAVSLASLIEAEAYMATVLTAYKAAWIAASDTDKEAMLQQASRSMFNFPWKGSRSKQTQSQCWPRIPAFSRNVGFTFGSGQGLFDSDGYQIDSVTIPQGVKNGCIEYAFRLISADRTADAGGLVPQELKSGSTTITGLKRFPVPASVYDLVSPYLKFDPRSGGDLVRS
jgi:hypothetical protein